MKGFSSRLKALKVDVIGPENILFAGESVHLSARNFFTGWGREGVKDVVTQRPLPRVVRVGDHGAARPVGPRRRAAGWLSEPSLP